MSSLRIDGIAEIQALLNDKAPRVARNLMRATVLAVAQNIAKDARQNAPVKTGTLKKAIKAKRKNTAPDEPASVVYITTGKGIKYDAFYWRFVEYGTRGYSKGDRRAGGKGRAKKSMPARPEHPFIRPALERAKANMNTMLRIEFGKKLEKQLAREARGTR